MPHDSYMVRIHGSRAPTKRNRKFLRKISPFHPMVPVQQEEFLPAPMVLRDNAGQAELPAPPVHPAGHPPPVQHLPEQLQPAAHTVEHDDQHVAPRHPAQVQPTAPASQHVEPGPAQMLNIPGQPRPAQVLPTAALHRHQPAAAPGQDVLAQLKMREAMGHVLTILMGYAINPPNM